MCAADDIGEPALYVSSDGGETYPMRVSSASAVVPSSSFSGDMLDIRHAVSEDDNVVPVPKLRIPRPDDLCSVELVRWFDSDIKRKTGAPFALGWKNSRANVMCGKSEKESVTLWARDGLARAPAPRWVKHRYEVTEKSVRDKEEKRSKKSKIGFLKRNQKYTLPIAIFMIIALAHGIYLGITEEEASHAHNEDVRRERLVAQQVTQAQIASRAGRAKRKGKK